MRGIHHSVELFQAFRQEGSSPELLYRLLADDMIAELNRHMDLEGRLVVDVGGGPGYAGEALRANGARCLTLDIDVVQLRHHDRIPIDAAIADACRLPVRGGSVDIAVSSNVLEHIQDPWALLSELARIVTPGGLIYLSFTNWYSPWGGHETSPWHYLGGERARARYTRTHGFPPGSVFGRNLFPIHISDVLTWIKRRRDLTVIEAAPRYYPSWCRGVVTLPLLREVLTWNLALVMVKTEP